MSFWTQTATNLNPDGWWRLNEINGTTALDQSGNNLNGEYRFAPQLNQSSAFDSSNNKAVNFTSGNARIGDVLDVDSGDFTVVSWFKKTSTSTSPMKVVNKGLSDAGTPANAGYQIRITDNILETSFVNDNGQMISLNIPEPSINNYHFVASVLDRDASGSSLLSLYLDPTTGNPSNTLGVESFGNSNTNLPLSIEPIWDLLPYKCNNLECEQWHIRAV